MHTNTLYFGDKNTAHTHTRIRTILAKEIRNYMYRCECYSEGTIFPSSTGSQGLSPLVF